MFKLKLVNAGKNPASEFYDPFEVILDNRADVMEFFSVALKSCKGFSCELTILEEPVDTSEDKNEF